MSDEVYKRVVRWRMRERRLNLSSPLRQEDVAERTGISLRRYQEYESGTRGFNPTLNTLIAIAKVLEIDPGELVKSHTLEEAKASLKKDKRRVFKT